MPENSVVIAALGVAMLLATPLQASAEIAIEVSGPGTQREKVVYDCGGKRLEVEYIQSDPDYLAIVPVEGHNQIFVLGMSGSGARYVSQQYVWWTHRDEASLYDEMKGEDAAPILNCVEKG